MAATTDTVDDPTTEEHFLDHIVESAHTVQTSEDIVTPSGIKLLAKGARVDAGTRERLLAHKLAKPLEQCLEIAEAIGGDKLKPIAQQLIDEQPLLRTLHGKASSVADLLGRLPLTSQLRSLLTLYAELPSDKLGHCVGVALFATGLAREVLADDDASLRTLLTAGLLHDVGELYVDPAFLKSSSTLQTSHWKHIVAHPVIGHRVLRDMDGAGRVVADAVLSHHERRDGFGYPRRLAGDALSTRGEVLAAAEWLGGMMRRGHSPLTRASAAARLMPGGFRDSIVRAILPAASAAQVQSAQQSGDVLARLTRATGTMSNFRRSLPWIQGLIDAGSGASAVLATNHGRMERIERSLARSGLSGDDAAALFARLDAVGDPALLAELDAVLREIGWRLRELERDTLLRAGSLAPADQAIVRELVARLKATPSDDA